LSRFPSLWLAVYPLLVVQLFTVNIRNIGPLCERRHADVFIHW